MEKLDTDERLPLRTSGETLLREFMEPLGLLANTLARAAWVQPNRISTMLQSRCTITAAIGLRMVRYLGTCAEYWLNLQSTTASGWRDGTSMLRPAARSSHAQCEN